LSLPKIRKFRPLIVSSEEFFDRSTKFGKRGKLKNVLKTQNYDSRKKSTQSTKNSEVSDRERFVARKKNCDRSTKFGKRGAVLDPASDCAAQKKPAKNQKLHQQKNLSVAGTQYSLTPLTVTRTVQSMRISSWLPT